MPSQYEVVVELKREVLDAEGRAIRDVLRKTGATAVEDVTVSRRFVVSIADSESQTYVENLAREFLANPVSETFKVKKLP